MEVDRLFGEIEPGVFEFKRGHENYNPFAKQWVGRYWQIARLTEPQVRGVQAWERQNGRRLTPYEICRSFNLPSSGAVPEEQIKAIEDYLAREMIDEMDRRCVELTDCESMPWFKTHGHLVRTFGMLHAMDWEVFREKLPRVLPALRGVSEVDAVERRYAKAHG